MTDVPILIPAAGFARRMRGADKLLEPVAGEALLHRQARLALATGATVLVTLPPAPGLRARALDGLAVTRVPVPDPGEGMAASIRAGLAAVPDGAAGLMILLADLPELEAQDLTALITAFRGNPARDLSHGRAGASGDLSRRPLCRTGAGDRRRGRAVGGGATPRPAARHRLAG